MPADTGRPPLYSDPLLMEAKIEQYFDSVEGPPTVAELCLYLGFNHRHALAEYEKKDEFTATIKKARTRIEVDREKRLLSKDSPTAGVIFDLTNNHGWKNPQHMKHSQDEDGDPVKIDLTDLTDEKLAAIASRGS